MDPPAEASRVCAARPLQQMTVNSNCSSPRTHTFYGRVGRAALPALYMPRVSARFPADQGLVKVVLGHSKWELGTIITGRTLAITYIICLNPQWLTCKVVEPRPNLREQYSL